MANDLNAATAQPTAQNVAEQIQEVLNANLNAALDAAGQLGFFEKRPIHLDKATKVTTIKREVTRVRPGTSASGYDNLQITFDKPYDGYQQDENGVFQPTETTLMSMSKGGWSRQMFNLIPNLANIADDNGSISAKDAAHYTRGAILSIDMFYFDTGAVLRDGDEPIDRPMIIKYLREVSLSQVNTQEIKLLSLSDALLSKVGAGLVASLLK